MMLHSQLQQDCFVLGAFDLSLLLLLNDKQYPWFILVPQRKDISEIHQLSTEEQHQLITESSALAQAIESTFQADKINIAALGNRVAQLHIHHIVRFKDDKAWPKPVWGMFPAVAYQASEVKKIQQQLTLALPSLTASDEIKNRSKDGY